MSDDRLTHRADDRRVHGSPGPRRSRAAVRSGLRRDTEGNIALALGANLVVGAAKLTVGLAIGSAVMLAEAVPVGRYALSDSP
jgi:hypothetical protein